MSRPPRRSEIKLSGRHSKIAQVKVLKKSIAAAELVVFKLNELEDLSDWRYNFFDRVQFYSKGGGNE